MADTASLTVRLDESLKQRLERAANAEDRSVSEYVVRSIKERLDVQCEQCGRSSGVSTLPVGLSPAFQKWQEEMVSQRNFESFYVTTSENGRRVVYWGRYRYDIAAPGALPIALFINAFAGEPTYPTAIPLGVITGWGWSGGAEGTEYFRLCDLGYVDGNEPARRLFAGRGRR